MRVLSNVLVLAGLAASVACGAPESGGMLAKAPDSAVAVIAAPPPPPRLVTKSYRGFYRRQDQDSRFQPCGTARPLDIYGPPEARQMLAERLRFGSMWAGLRMFGVFQGAIVTDTVKPTPPDSGAGTARTRFLIVRVDSLRVWRSTDCGGMRVP
jgi:hypothetical protein